MRSRASTASIVVGISLALVAPRMADAHALAPSVLELHELNPGRAEVLWKTPVVGVPGAPVRPVLPNACRPLDQPEIQRTETALIARWQIDCEHESLVGAELAAEGIAESRAAVVLLVTLRDGRSLRAVLTADRPSFVVPERQKATEIARSYARLGIDHILTGVDHLLFVLGLLLLITKRRRLVWTLTAFTLGHSVTLSLAALGLVHIPTAPVEAAIAASILVLAVELARDPAGARRSLVQRYPWGVAATFGLLHGLGFAGALAEAGLPDGEIPLALFSFNLGIEIGQLAFVAAVIVLRAAAGPRLPGRREVRRLVPAYAIGSLAALWLFQRIAVMV